MQSLPTGTSSSYFIHQPFQPGTAGLPLFDKQGRTDFDNKPGAQFGISQIR